MCCGQVGLIANVKLHFLVSSIGVTYCYLPAGWGLQQTTRAPGSDKTRGQGSFGPFTGRLNLTPTGEPPTCGDRANLLITTQKKILKEERTVHWTRFTKGG